MNPAMIEALKSKAVEVRYSPKCWQPMIRDKAKEQEIQLSTGCQDSGIVKKPVINRRDWKPVTSALSAANKYHYDHSLEYRRGRRIVLTQNLDRYRSDMITLSDRFVQAAKDLLNSHYDDLVARALRDQAGYLQKWEIPSAEEIMSQCKYDLEFFEFSPTSSRIIGIADETRAQLEAAERSRFEVTINGAMSDAWQRIAERLTQYKAGLEKYQANNGKGKGFTDSLLCGLAEVAQTITELNWTDDNDLATFAERCNQLVAPFDAAALKHDLDARQTQIERAQELMDQMHQTLQAKGIHLDAEKLAKFAATPEENETND